MTLDIEEIRRRLPHRYPFLLVDRVVSVIPGERIEAYKNLTINEPFFDGHFPGMPVFPGVLLLEAMALLTELLSSPDLKFPNGALLRISIDCL